MLGLKTIGLNTLRSFQRFPLSIFTPTPLLSGSGITLTAIIRVALGSVQAKVVQSYGNFYIPPTVIELDKLAMSQKPYDLKLYLAARALSEGGSSTLHSVNADFVLQPFIFSQLGLAIGLYRSSKQIDRMINYVDAVELLAAEALDLPRGKSYNVSRLQAVWQFATRKAKPHVIVAATREALEAKNRGDMVGFETARGRARVELEKYGTVD